MPKPHPTAQRAAAALARIPVLLSLLVLAATAALLLLPPPPGMPEPAARAAGLVLFAVGFWATGIIPEVVTAISFFLLAMLFEVAPPAVVFSGFASTALWLVFGGLFIGVAVARTGLGAVLARAFLDRIGASYLSVLSGVAVACIGLSFLMPSVMGRVLLLVPVAVAVADRIGFGSGSRGRAGIVMVTLLTTYMPSCGILPSNVPNMVLAGAAETAYGVTMTYGRYFLLHFPVLGIVKTVIIVLLAWALFRDSPRPPEPAQAPATMSRGARRLLVLLLIALGFWITDFLHHISPAWVALAVTVVLLLPRVGLLPIAVFNEGVNFGSYFLVAAILGIGALVGGSGLGDVMGRLLLSALDLAPGEDFRSFMALGAVWTLLGVLFTVAGLPAVLTPLSADVAQAAGWPLETVLMTQVLGYSTVLLPYQMGPLIVGVALGGITAADGARIMLPLAVATFAVVLPLDFLWWSWLGHFG